jgi:hypothetical protein
VGVYVVWVAGGTWLYVGRGKIGDRLSLHVQEGRFASFIPLGLIVVTWAPVHETLQGGVERYLQQRLRPVVGNRWSDDVPIPVNLPA